MFRLKWKLKAVLLLFPILLLFQNCGVVGSGNVIQQAFQSNNNISHAYSRKPSLNDLFNGRARFQTIEESEQIHLKFHSNNRIFDQKIPVLFNSKNKKYYTFTRSVLANHIATGNKKAKGHRFQIVMLEGEDGVNFKQKTKPLFNDMRATWTFYDAHISFNPIKKLYTMTMECAKLGVMGASLCISESRNPYHPKNWSRPKLVLGNGDRYSASTGVVLNHNNKNYLSWTVVDDINKKTFSKATQLHTDAFEKYFNYGNSKEVGKTILDVHKPNCRGWDCNNIDVQDWKVEGNKFYAIYNGANYFRCNDIGKGKNHWGLSIRRSNKPLGEYSESTGILIDAKNKNICGISYPVINKVNGAIYMYYSYYENDLERNNRRNYVAKVMRSKLIWGRPLDISRRTKRSSLRTKVDTRDSAAKEQIESLYAKVLNRSVKAGEMRNHLGFYHRHGLKQLARRVYLSPESQSKQAKLNANKKVTVLYRAFLDRAPDSNGQSYFMNRIARGESANNILNGVINSREFKIKTQRKGLKL